jgi:poly(3-hydroxybutyrate) depolymerase
MDPDGFEADGRMVFKKEWEVAERAHCLHNWINPNTKPGVYEEGFRELQDTSSIVMAQKAPQRIEAPSATDTNAATFIFLHGYGDDADGWTSMSGQLSLSLSERAD